MSIIKKWVSKYIFLTNEILSLKKAPMDCTVFLLDRKQLE